MVAAAEQIGEQLERLVSAADARQGIDVPECAEQKGVRWSAEIIGLSVAHHEAVPHQAFAHDIERRVEAGIVRTQQADLGKHQTGGIEHVAVENARQPTLGRGAALQHLLAQNSGPGLPFIGFVDGADAAPDLAETMLSCPAHRGRERVHLFEKIVYQLLRGTLLGTSIYSGVQCANRNW